MARQRASLLPCSSRGSVVHHRDHLDLDQLLGLAELRSEQNDDCLHPPIVRWRGSERRCCPVVPADQLSTTATTWISTSCSGSPSSDRSKTMIVFIHPLSDGAAASVAAAL